MNIKLCLVIICLGFFSLAHSQTFFVQKSAFGVEAGYIMGEFTEEFPDDPKDRSTQGFYGGINSQFFLEDKSFIKVDVLLSFVQESFWLHLPVLYKHYITNQISLVAGPQLSVIVGQKTPYNSFGIDLGAGAAFDITDNIYLQAKYNFEITNTRLQKAALDTGSRHNTIFAGIGYRFLD